MKKILGMIGSPRKLGNCEIMVKKGEGQSDNCSARYNNSTNVGLPPLFKILMPSSKTFPFCIEQLHPFRSPEQDNAAGNGEQDIGKCVRSSIAQSRC